MRIFNAFVILGSISCSLAQTFQIGLPLPGAKLHAGVPFVVQLQQPVAIGIMQTVSAVIGIQRCGTTPCSNTTNDGIFGEILYAGDFTPVRHEPQLPPYQNFTFTLDDTTNGKATIHVADLFLVGAGPSPTLLSKNVSVSIHV